MAIDMDAPLTGEYCESVGMRFFEGSWYKIDRHDERRLRFNITWPELSLEVQMDTGFETAASMGSPTIRDLHYFAEITGTIIKLKGH